jgi:tetratricopeptide (TPR) repeat protein
MGLGGLGMAAALRPARPAGAARPRRGTAALVVAGAIAIGVSLLLPWLAERNISRAGDLWRADVGGALRLLDDAASLNPLSARPSLTAGTIALRVEDFGRAEQEFEEALAREPESSYALLELGLIASVHGERRRAVELLEQAVALSPRDRVARAALRAARRGRRLDPAAVNRRILERARERQSDAL